MTKEKKNFGANDIFAAVASEGKMFFGGDEKAPAKKKPAKKPSGKKAKK